MATRKNETHTFEIGGEDLTKTAMIYWPNASWKTTLLDALYQCDLYIRKSIDKSTDEWLPYNPFKFSLWKWKPTTFEIVFSLETTIYAYTFSFNADEILSEKLVNESKNKILFLRKWRKIIKNDEKLFFVASDLETSTVKNALMLTRAAQTWTNIAQAIVESFKKNINIINRWRPRVTIDLMQNDENLKEKVLKHLQEADYCIKDIMIEEQEIDDTIRKKFDIPKNAKSYWVKMMHPAHDEWKKYIKNIELDIEDESKGTKSFFNMIWPIVDTLEKWNILCVDEIDNSLHPLLMKYIIDLFESAETNPHNAQLIVTIHDVSLLNWVKYIRDNFWFTDKNKYWEATLYSLSEFKNEWLRNESKYQNDYLEGRFGAIPFIS